MKQNKVIGHIHFIPNCLWVETNAVIFEKNSTEQNKKTKPKTNPINKLSKWMIIVILYCKLSELLKIKPLVYIFYKYFSQN